MRIGTNRAASCWRWASRWLWTKTAKRNEQGNPKYSTRIKTSENCVNCWIEIEAEVELSVWATVAGWDWDCAVGTTADEAITLLASIMPNQTGVRCFMIVVKMLEKKFCV
jgi:hypothetical protein